MSAIRFMYKKKPMTYGVKVPTHIHIFCCFRFGYYAIETHIKHKLFYFVIPGINLRNGNRGIFPSAYVVDVDYNDFDPTMEKMKRERFLLSYLGSVETLCHKGNSVLCQAVRKIISTKHIDYHSCILEVSDHGLRMYNKLNPTVSCALDRHFYLQTHPTFTFSVIMGYNHVPNPT